MNASDIDSILSFLRAAEALKVTHRSGATSGGNPESVAEHSWRLCLMAMVLAPEFPTVDVARLLKICIVHDLGEAVGGDIPAPEQERRVISGAPSKSEDERRDLMSLTSVLPPRQRDEIVALWDEYEAGATAEARLAKAFDKLETILQHTQGAHAPGFDYRFNLRYGRQYTEQPALIASIRAILDAETARLAEVSERGAVGR